MSFGPLEFEVGDVVEWWTPSGAIMRPCRTPLGPSEKTAQEGDPKSSGHIISGVFSFWPMIS